MSHVVRLFCGRGTPFLDAALQLDGTQGVMEPAVAPAMTAQVGRRESKRTIAELSVQGAVPKACRPFALYT